MINVRETITVNTRPKARSFKCRHVIGENKKQ